MDIAATRHHDVVLDRAMRRNPTYELRQAILGYLKRCGPEHPVLIGRAVSALRKSPGVDPTIPDDALGEMIARVAIEHGRNVHFDKGEG
jgi:hypothetical protein